MTLHFLFDAAESVADVLALYAPGAAAAPDASLADALCCRASRPGGG